VIHEHRTRPWTFQKIFGIHLFLSGLAASDLVHFVTGLFGPGIWVSDPYGITGVQPVALHGVQKGLIHIIQEELHPTTWRWAEMAGVLAGPFHLCVRPSQRLCRATNG
jgi:photosystem II CP47 chlorophyll apoprotein